MCHDDDERGVKIIMRFYIIFKPKKKKPADGKGRKEKKQPVIEVNEKRHI